jgi:phospholipase A1
MPSRSTMSQLTSHLGTALMALPALAWAQTAPSALAECAAIANDSERLACFDRISGRAPRPASEPKNDAAPAPAPAASAAGSDASSIAVTTPVASGSGSMYDKSWSFDPSSPRYDISLYAPNYFLFGRYTTDLNTAPFYPLVDGVLAPGTELDSTEAAFQLSFKFRFWTTDDRRWGAWAAYTQQSQWQLYNDSGNASRPFRETNYMPELILSYKPGLEWGGLQWNLLNLAFNHQSNGRTDKISRSWDRVIASFGVEQGNLGVLARLWWRLPESSDSDDNPTISDYYGWGDLSAIYKWRGQSFSGSIRGNPSTRKGAGQLTWTSAPLLGPLRGYVKVFSGYGETLIDYNWNQTTFGIGVTLNDWL